MDGDEYEDVDEVKGAAGYAATASYRCRFLLTGYERALRPGCTLNAASRPFRRIRRSASISLALFNMIVGSTGDA